MAFEYGDFLIIGGHIHRIGRRGDLGRANPETFADASPPHRVEVGQVIVVEGMPARIEQHNVLFGAPAFYLAFS